LPSLSKLSPLAKVFGIPYIPVVPTLLPMPTKVTLRFGEPIVFDSNPDEPDSEVHRKVELVRNAIRSELETGLRARGERIFTGVGI